MYTSPDVGHMISGIISYSQKTFPDPEVNSMFTIPGSPSIFSLKPGVRNHLENAHVRSDRGSSLHN